MILKVENYSEWSIIPYSSVVYISGKYEYSDQVQTDSYSQISYITGHIGHSYNQNIVLLAEMHMEKK